MAQLLDEFDDEQEEDVLSPLADTGIEEGDNIDPGGPAAIPAYAPPEPEPELASQLQTSYDRDFDSRRFSTFDPRGFIRKATPEEDRVIKSHFLERVNLGLPQATEQFLADAALPDGGANPQAEAFIHLWRRRSTYGDSPDEATTLARLVAESGIGQDLLKDPEVLKDVKLREQRKRDAFALVRAPHKMG